ncbi:hypothetical protein FRC12_004752 [Ceratobasidium sp. 428]|nr:hypothetical protein FRC12_004752 [Ceratobasidium sp. 428]
MLPTPRRKSPAQENPMSDQLPQQVWSAAEPLHPTTEILPHQSSAPSVAAVESHIALPVGPSNNVTAQDAARKPQNKPQLPPKPENVSADHDIEYLKGIGRGGRVWTTYVKESREHDDELVDGWNRFVLESVKSLQPDPSDQTVAILLDISQAIRRNQSGDITTMASNTLQPDFRPTTSAIWVNALWFLSLSLSVAVSLVTMLAKQWCYYFLHARTGDAITQAEERQRRFEGVAAWRMRGILEHLPVLMHISLALFLIGLVLYLWSINVAVASVVSGITISAICFYFGATFVPVKVEYCPFKTPQSVYTKLAINALLKTQIFRTLPPRLRQQFQSLQTRLKGWVSRRSSASILGSQEGHDPHGLTNPPTGHSRVLSGLRKYFSTIYNSLSRWCRPYLTSSVRQGNDPEAPVESTTGAVDIPAENAPGANHVDDQSRESADDEDDESRAEPFVGDALKWLILHSQNSESIDVAISALVVGKVKLQDEDLTNRINSHLVKHFSDCFRPSGAGGKMLLQSPGNSFHSVLEYVEWMSYFAGDDLQKISQQVLQFKGLFTIEAATQLGLGLASLAQNKQLSPSAGRKIVLWLSSFIKNYDEGNFYLDPDALSAMIDGLTAASLHYCYIFSQDSLENSLNAKKRFENLAISHLTEILWKVSHIAESQLRASIGLNLAVFALTTNLFHPVDIDTKRAEYAAFHLAIDYRAPEDRQNSFVSFIVFALLSILHPESHLDLSEETTITMCSLIQETNYLAGTSSSSMSIPQLEELDPLSRRMTAMLLETMTQTHTQASYSNWNLWLTVCDSNGLAEWSDFADLIQTKRSTLHAICTLISVHFAVGDVLKESALVAAMDLLFREVKTLQRLDYTILKERLPSVVPAKRVQDLEPQVSDEGGAVPSGLPTSSPDPDALQAELLAKMTPEEIASHTLDLVMKKSNTRQCIETAVRAVLHHSNRCDVDLVVGATQWFKSRIDELNQTQTEDQILNISGYARILTSMVLHCLEPDDLSKRLCGQDTTDTEKRAYETVKMGIQLLVEAKGDAHVHAFGVSAAAIWRFACPNGTYPQQETNELLSASWDLILRHSEASIRPEALEALIDTTVLFAAVTEPACMISDIMAQVLLRLLANVRYKEEHIRPALAVAVTFWGLSLDQDRWDFWSLENRKRLWRQAYTRSEPRKRDKAALFLLGLSRFLANFTTLRLDHMSIKTIAMEIDHYMRKHSDKSVKLTLPFLSGFDVRRHVREVVATYIKDTESHGPFQKSVAESRNRLLTAIQLDGGEGFQYEIPQPFAYHGKRTSEASELK